MEQSELDADGDLDVDFAGFKPRDVIITHDKAIENLHELTRYLQTLKVSCLETPTGRVLLVSDFVEKTSHLVSAITQYVPRPIIILQLDTSMCKTLCNYKTLLRSSVLVAISPSEAVIPRSSRNAIRSRPIAVSGH